MNNMFTIRGIIFALFPHYNKSAPNSEEMVDQTTERLRQLDRDRPEVILMPEPENIHDPKAVRAWCEGSPIGYVAHEETDLAGLLFDDEHPMVSARIVKVEVERKGNLYVTAELPEANLAKQFALVQPSTAWEGWRCTVPALPMPDAWKDCRVLEFQLERLFPKPEETDLPLLKKYLKGWTDKSLHDFSVEAMQTRSRYIGLLQGMGIPALEPYTKRLVKQSAGICSGQRMTYRMQWWKEIQQSDTMNRYWDKWRSSRREDNLWRDLYEVDLQLRRMPDNLYAHIGDLTCLFSAMRYRDDVSRRTLWEVYTLLLLRERICRNLGIRMQPLPMQGYRIDSYEEDETPLPALTDARLARAVEEDEPSHSFTEKQLKASGIRMHPDVVIELMRAMQYKYVQKVDWLSFYSVLLRRRWVDDNLSAWCRMVESIFSISLDHRTLSRVLKKDGPDYTTWTDADERILRRKLLATEFDTRLTEYFEQKRAKVLEGLRK